MMKPLNKFEFNHWVCFFYYYWHLKSEDTCPGETTPESILRIYYSMDVSCGLSRATKTVSPDIPGVLRVVRVKSYSGWNTQDGYQSPKTWCTWIKFDCHNLTNIVNCQNPNRFKVFLNKGLNFLFCIFSNSKFSQLASLAWIAQSTPNSQSMQTIWDYVTEVHPESKYQPICQLLDLGHGGSFSGWLIDYLINNI